jgi:hypothetical protein
MARRSVELRDRERLKRVLELVAEKSGWGTPLPKGHGRGIALHYTFGSYAAEVADVSVDAQQRVRVHRVVAACARACCTPSSEVPGPRRTAARGRRRRARRRASRSSRLRAQEPDRSAGRGRADSTWAAMKGRRRCESPGRGRRAWQSAVGVGAVSALAAAPGKVRGDQGDVARALRRPAPGSTRGAFSRTRRSSAELHARPTAATSALQMPTSGGVVAGVLGIPRVGVDRGDARRRLGRRAAYARRGRLRLEAGGPAGKWCGRAKTTCATMLSSAGLHHRAGLGADGRPASHHHLVSMSRNRYRSATCQTDLRPHRAAVRRSKKQFDNDAGRR